MCLEQNTLVFTNVSSNTSIQLLVFKRFIKIISFFVKFKLWASSHGQVLNTTWFSFRFTSSNCTQKLSFITTPHKMIIILPLCGESRCVLYSRNQTYNKPLFCIRRSRSFRQLYSIFSKYTGTLHALRIPYNPSDVNLISGMVPTLPGLLHAISKRIDPILLFCFRQD